MEDQKSQTGRSRRRSRKARYHDFQVKVEESFSLREPREGFSQERAAAGDGCYVSATVNNSRRFYGVLVDQEALKAASLLHFQDEAGGLELNRKIHNLLQQQKEEASNGDHADRKRPAVDPLSGATHKRQKPDNVASTSVLGERYTGKPVQKFRYEQPVGNGSSQGYRELLATFANVNAAAEDDADRAKRISAACESGGNFVGVYYYQYEAKCLALEAGDHNSTLDPNVVRMSMGFQSFLQATSLPPWFPLSNLQVDQQKVLSLLNMKRDNSGNAVWDATNSNEITASVRSNLSPMKTRDHFRVAVLGGGISGLSCCREIFRECERQQIPVQIVLLEGRKRFGGRLWTDRETFKCSDGESSFPVDLGASWIHGIELNPLASLAREAGVDFVTSSEDVKMFEAGMKEVDHSKDERAGEVFDKLLDLAAEDCWQSNRAANEFRTTQLAVRWYASILDETSSEKSDPRPVATQAPPHRQSGDISVDRAVGRAVAEKRFSEFSRLSDEERHMLCWNLKNIEYALGANTSDLSMRFWDIDERHAFEGDHVMLRQGYSAVVDYLVQDLSRRGSLFDYKLNFPVGSVEYSRRTTTCGALTGNRKVVELSDTCRVTAEDSSLSLDCDFVVSCVPLGVLKEAVRAKPEAKSIRFDPPLPFSKRDAIESVGFGLLDKVYLQFPNPFWRAEGVFDDDQTLFGNASGVNPHHYMFFDVGKSLGSSSGRPAVLMSLVSGREAVKCEFMTETALVDETMATLRTLFSGLSVPDPIASRVTRWGKDRFARGSYTFLPPGTTDQDFELLRSPVNGNGDSLLLEGSETMRLFFAGEHTTALHPSMAHGALLSGVRAAKEVVSAMNLSFDEDESIDKLIPMPLFRYLNPSSPLNCGLCHRVGTTMREGSLLAFKRGSRQALVHNNCAENSPEVEVFEGNWKNVFKAINRSRSIECFLCGQDGASIGCFDPNCYRCYHFSCAEDTGWRFDKDGKEYFCELHRTVDVTQTVRISLDFHKSVHGKQEALLCGLCGGFGQDRKCGSLLAFRKGSKMAVVHENCAKYSTICDVGADKSSRMEHEYRNIFDVISLSKKCERCSRPGATTKCSEASCPLCFHFSCAEETNWDFSKRSRFRCQKHRNRVLQFATVSRNGGPTSVSHGASGSVFQHSLFSAGAMDSNKDVPGNLDIDKSDLLPKKESNDIGVGSSDEDYSSEEERGGDSAMSLQEHGGVDTPFSPDEPPDQMVQVDYILTSDYNTNRHVERRLARLFRSSVSDPWNVEFYITRLGEQTRKAVLSVAIARPDPYDEIRDGDVVVAINGLPVGSLEMDTLEKVLSRLAQEVDAMVEVVRTLY